MKPYRDLLKVSKVILSCKTVYQLKASQNMIKLYAKKYPLENIHNIRFLQKICTNRIYTLEKGDKLSKWNGEGIFKK